MSQSSVHAAILADVFDETPAYAIRRQRGAHNWLMFATTSGGGRLEHDHGWLELHPGSVAVLLPGTAHHYQTNPSCARWQFAWSHFKPEAGWLPLLTWPEPYPGLRVLPDHEAAIHQRIVASLTECAAFLRSGEHRHVAFAHNALHRALLWCGEAQPTTHTDPRLMAAVEYARRNLHQPIHLADLAHAARLSPARLSRTFAAAMGLPPLRWVEEQRMAQAALLLQADQTPIADIATRVGFADAFYFSRRFKAWSGHAPRAWRQTVTPR